MIFLLAIATFGAALGISAYAIAETVGPNLHRIRLALIGQSPIPFVPAPEMARGERRIRVRPQATPRNRSAASWRAAA